MGNTYNEHYDIIIGPLMYNTDIFLYMVDIKMLNRADMKSLRLNYISFCLQIFLTELSKCTEAGLLILCLKSNHLIH